MPLVTPPSFMSPEALSARFHYAPRGTNDHVMTLGTTGHSFISRAWATLQRIDFARDPLNARAYAANYEPSAADLLVGRRGTGFNTFATQGRGTRWDNDFNRALWAWTFLKWNEQTVRMNLPRADDQLFGGATSEQREGWVRALNAIEWCEVNQSVSKDAMLIAELLVADSLGLVDNVTTPRVSMDSSTVLLRYNTDPPLPSGADRTAGNEFKTWARSGSSEAATSLGDRPVLPPVGGNGGTGAPGTGQGSPHDAGGSSGPLGPPGMSPTVVTALKATAVVGGVLLIAGIGIYLTAKSDGGI